MRFKDKIAVVTGAAQGIGEAYAKALAKEGASVLVADLNADKGRAVVDDIKKAGHAAAFHPTDVASEQSCFDMARTAKEAFGGIDFLINNAAIYAGMKMEPLLTVDLDYYTRFMQVNFTGVLLATRACYGAMVERGGGVIINQSSAAAFMPGNQYGLAKLGVNGLTVGLSRELGPRNIRVNAIAPGPVDTDATMTTVPEPMLKAIVQQMPLGRIGTVEDIVKACMFLLSEDASWITGQILRVDGGQILRA